MDMEKTESSGTAPQTPKRRWRRAVVATSVLGGMLLSGMSVLPWAVMSSSHRDSILNAKLEKFGLTATSESGSGGWLSAFSFNNVSITDSEGQITCSINSIQTSKSLLSILTGGHDLGTVTVIQPELRVALDENGNLPIELPEKEETDDSSKWDVAFDIQNAGFVLSVPWRKVPIVELDDLDIAGAVATDETGRWLTVEPIDVFDYEPLSELHTEQNLALIAPVLSQSTSLSGEISARLDGIRKKLDREDTSPWLIRGQATLHSVRANLKKDWAMQVSQFIGRATGRDTPARLEIARESTVHFEVDDRGIHHHGLAFLLPDLAGNMHIESSGMLGLDESLDLTLAVGMPQILPRGPFMAALSKMVRNPLQLKVKGTVSDPELVTPPGASLADQLAGNLSPETQGTEPPSVQGAVMDLLGSAASRNPQQSADGIASGVLNVIRAAQEARKNAPPKEPRRKKRRERRGL